MGHAPYGHSNKGQQKKGPWTPEEDFLLTKYIETHGEGQWRTLPKKAGLQRCGKGCRLRWMNYLRPNVKRGNISTEEEELIIRLHRLLGNRWSLIAGRVPGRTDNEIKNYWNTRLSKKIRANAIARTTTADYKSKSSYVSHPDLKQSIFHQAMAYAERRNQIDKSVPATDNTSIIRQVFDGSSNNANVHGGDWDNDNPRSENYLYNSTDPLDQLNQACGIGAVKQDSPWHHADNQMIPSCSYEQQYINATNPFSDYLASYQMPTTSMHQLKDPNSVYLSGIENIYYYDNDLSSGAIFSDEAHFLSTVSADCIDGFTFDAELHNCDRKEAQKLNASEQYHSLDAEFHGSCFTHFFSQCICNSLLDSRCFCIWIISGTQIDEILRM